MINKKLAMQTVNYVKDNFYSWSVIDLNDDEIYNIY